MKLSWTLVLAVAISGVAAGAGDAGADECRLGCNHEKRACIHGARMQKLGCKLACRETATPTELGACIRACVETFLAEKDSCRNDHGECREICLPPPPGDPPPVDRECLIGCGEDLVACARRVLTRARECVHGCATASDRHACLLRCAAEAQAGALACARDFHACVADCGLVTTSTTATTSTTTSTLFPELCGFDPAHGECAGFCPFGLRCLPPPPGSLVPLACICQPGSPSGAFLEVIAALD
jgi:hypothetical protein